MDIKQVEIMSVVAWYMRDTFYNSIKKPTEATY